jgi:hypothetical protein
MFLEHHLSANSTVYLSLGLPIAGGWLTWLPASWKRKKKSKPSISPIRKESLEGSLFMFGSKQPLNAELPLSCKVIPESEDNSDIPFNCHSRIALQAFNS